MDDYLFHSILAQLQRKSCLPAVGAVRGYCQWSLKKVVISDTWVASWSILAQTIIQPSTEPIGNHFSYTHYNDVIMGAIASHITSLTMFAQPLIQAQIKENIKAPRHWPLPVTGKFPAQRSSNAKNVSIWWRHHVHRQPYCHQAKTVEQFVLSTPTLCSRLG